MCHCGSKSLHLFQQPPRSELKHPYVEGQLTFPRDLSPHKCVREYYENQTKFYRFVTGEGKWTNDDAWSIGRADMCERENKRKVSVVR